MFDDVCLDIIGEFGVFPGVHFRFSLLLLIGINLERDEWERNLSDDWYGPFSVSISVKGGK